MADFTDEEAKCLLDSFKWLNVKPKGDTPEELVEWMKCFTQGYGGTELKVDTSDINHGPRVSPAVAIQQPRISIFTGELPLGKSDTAYDMWLYEVRCLMMEKSILSIPYHKLSDAHSEARLVESLCVLVPLLT